LHVCVREHPRSQARQRTEGRRRRGRGKSVPSPAGLVSEVSEPGEREPSRRCLPPRPLRGQGERDLLKHLLPENLHARNVLFAARHRRLVGLQPARFGHPGLAGPATGANASAGTKRAHARARRGPRSSFPAPPRAAAARAGARAAGGRYQARALPQRRRTAIPATARASSYWAKQ